MKKLIFNNQDLTFDMEKIKSFDTPIKMGVSYDANLDYPFAIDIEDTSYWYAKQEERDKDFEKLKSNIKAFIKK